MRPQSRSGAAFAVCPASTPLAASANFIVAGQPSWGSPQKGPNGFSCKLRFRYQTSQELWRELGAIRPADRAKPGIQDGLLKLIEIKKRFKHWTCQLCGQTNFYMGPIVKLKQKRMPRNDLQRCDVKHDGFWKGN